MNSASALNVAALRDQTPGCTEVAFLNNAGAALMTRETTEAVISHLHLENRVGGYLAQDQVAPTIARAKAGLAKLVGGQATEVALSVSDSAIWVKAIWGWMLGRNVKAGERVLIDRLAYHSHHAALVQLSELFGFEIVEIDSLADGTVDVGFLATLLEDERCSLACITAIGTHCGCVNPMAEIGALLRARGIPMFVDGCQALGHLAVDVHAWGASLFSGTGRKWLRGPRGTGMLWVDERIVERFRPPGIDGTSTDWNVASGFSIKPGMGRFEEFEGPIAAQVGLAVAVNQALELDRVAVETHIVETADRFRSALSEIDGVIHHDSAARRCGIVTFSVDGVEPTEVVAAAASRGATINSSSATWAALDMHAKGLTSVVRVSPHIYNTDDELGVVLEAVRSVRPVR